MNDHESAVALNPRVVINRTIFWMAVVASLAVPPYLFFASGHAWMIVPSVLFTAFYFPWAWRRLRREKLV
jgi:hypothetical protein